MRILILGGDGYLGWPTSMYFSARGHEVHAVDNYLRRRAHQEAGTDSLTPVLDTLPARADAWRQVTGYRIGVTEGDLCDWEVVERLFRDFEPEAIVHYGEMPSAPYSFISREHAVFTQYNNVVSTLNVLWAMRDFTPDAHMVKLGTMGEYGTPNIDLEEGYILIHHNGREDRLPFPKLPGSWYHASKVHDSTNIHLACRIWGLNILDTLQCVELATMNPAAPGEFRVFNQFTEQFSINELAELVQRAGAEYGLDVRVEHVDNPRVEAEEHYYNAKHSALLDLGLKPHYLSETLVESIFAKIEDHKDRVTTEAIMPKTRWRPAAQERESVSG